MVCLVFGTDLDIRSKGGQGAGEHTRGWEHIRCLSGSRQKDIHSKCEKVTKFITVLGFFVGKA